MGVERVTFEVDKMKLFDLVAQVGDGGADLGLRLVSVLLAGGDWRDAIGMEIYGVRVAERSDG